MWSRTSPAAAVAQHSAAQLAGAVEECAGSEDWSTVTRPHDAAVRDVAAEECEVGHSVGSGRER